MDIIYPYKQLGVAMSLIAEVYEALKIIDKGSVSELLELLQKDFSTEWVDPTIKKESISRKIKNKLNTLIEMNLITLEKKVNRQKTNIYAIKHNFPVQTKAPQLANELLEIIKKDEKIYLQAKKSINGLLHEIKSPYYIHQYSEDIGSIQEIVGKLESAINDRRYVKVTYNKNTIKVCPLKIAEFDGLWYLLHYYDRYDSYLKYRLLDIKDITLTKDKFELNGKMNLEIEKWHNVWHIPNQIPTKITLWIDKDRKKFFYKKNLLNINLYAERISPCSDGIEYDVYITHPYEVLPTIMQYQPHVTILRQEGTIDLIGKYRTLLNETLNRLDSVS